MLIVLVVASFTLGCAGCAPVKPSATPTPKPSATTLPTYTPTPTVKPTTSPSPLSGLVQYETNNPFPIEVKRSPTNLTEAVFMTNEFMWRADTWELPRTYLDRGHLHYGVVHEVEFQNKMTSNQTITPGQEIRCMLKYTENGLTQIMFTNAAFYDPAGGWSQSIVLKPGEKKKLYLYVYAPDDEEFLAHRAHMSETVGIDTNPV